MSSVGQIIGGIAGAILGYFIPGVGHLVGTMIGFQLGMGIGSFIDPPKSNEADNQLQPQDIQFNSFARNLPVPVIYGENKVAGNVLWFGNTRTEVRERDAGGGGGTGQEAPKIKELFYHADFHVGLGEGTITDVDSIFVNNQDISEMEGLNYDIYFGTADQATDPRMVTAVGANALPMRNTAYLSVTGELGQINRLPIVQSIVNGIVLGAAPNSGAAWTRIASAASGLSGIGGTLRDGAGRLFAWEHPTNTAIWRSTDGGSSWIKVASSGIGVVAFNMASRKTNDYLYAIPGAGADPNTKNLFRSIDNGVTWSLVIALSGVAGIDQWGGTTHSVIAPGSQTLAVVVPFKTSNLAVDNIQKIAVSYDEGANWSVSDEPDAVSGTPKAFGLISPEAMPGRLVLGTVVGAIYVSDNGGSSWARTYTGQGSGYGIPEKWERAFATGGKTVVFINTTSGIGTTATGSFTKAKVAVSVDGGNTWRTSGSTVAGAGGLDWLSHLSRTNWIGSWHASGEVWRTRNAGRSWQRLGGIVGSIGERVVTAIDPSRYLVAGAGPPFEVFELPVGDDNCNPAWIIYDLLTNGRYGLGLDEDRLDIASFDEVADYCDELVVNPDGTTEPRYCLDIVLEQNRPILDHLRDMLATFRGFLVWSQGVVKLRVAKTEDVTQSFDMGNILADSFVWKKQGYRERPNVMRIEYINRADDFRRDFVEAFDDWDIDTTGERRERILRLTGIKRPTQASRMAQYYLDQAIHINHAIAFRVGIAALASEVGDVIQVSHDVPGWTNKPFRVMEIAEAENDEIQLTCIEYIATVYHDSAIGDPQPVIVVPVNPDAIPYQLIRLAPYKKAGEQRVEIGYTRATSADFFGGALLYMKRGANAYEAMPPSGILLGPSAFLDSQVFSYTRTAAGSYGGFADAFTRTDNDSLGADWNEVAQTLWRVNCNQLQRGDPGSGDGTAGVGIAVTSGHKLGGDSNAFGDMVHTQGLGVAPKVGLVAYWQSTNSQGYVLDYATRTVSHSILEVGLWKVMSGNVWSQLSFAYVNSGTYFTTPNSPTTFRLEVNSGGLVGRLNSAEIVRASDAYQDAVLVDSPVGYWRFGEVTGTAKDSTGRSFIGSVVAGTSRGLPGALSGDADTSYFFRGSSGATVVISHNALLQPNSLITVEAWIFPHSWTAFAPIAIKMNSAGASIGWELVVRSGGGIKFSHQRDGPGLSTGVATVPLSQWSHVVGVFNGGAEYLAIYVNATLQASAAETVPMSTQTTPMMIGGFEPFNLFLCGRIDEVAVYETALSSARVSAHYQTGLTRLGSGEAGFARRQALIGYADVVRADSPSAYWRMGEPAGIGAVPDWIGTFPGSLHGVSSGLTTPGCTGALIGDNNRSVAFKGGTLGGVAARVRIPTTPLGDSSALTLEAWMFSPTQPASAMPLFGRASGANSAENKGYYLRVNCGGVVQFSQHGISNELTTPLSAIVANTWHHVVGTWEGSYQNIWVDATLVASRAQTKPMSTSGVTAGADIGYNEGGSIGASYIGRIHEVAVYPTALSSAQIFVHYQTGVGSGAVIATQGERWDNLQWDSAGSITLRAVPDGWSARISTPNCATLVSAEESSNTVVLAWPYSSASGFLVVFTDGASYATSAPGGRYPETGVTSFQSGDVYDYLRLQTLLTDTRTSVPLYAPKGGFANVGSARLRAEELGYATFADSLLSGATRGAGGSTATSHTNVLSAMWVVGSGSTGTGSGQFIDHSAAATQPFSNVAFLAQNSRYLVFGAGSRFSRLIVDLAVNASHVISYIAEYSTGAGSWAACAQSGFIPITDSTCGFTRSGEFLFEPWGDWEPTSTLASGTTLGDGTSRYAIRLLRTSSLLTTPPQEMRALIDGETLVTILPTPSQAFYTPVLVDSGQTLLIKAVAVSPTNVAAAATQAPTRTLVTGPYLP